MLSKKQIEEFNQQGYLLLKSFCPDPLWQDILSFARQQLEQRVAPYELEAELNYPGAPQQQGAGSATIRRLLGAYQRHQCIQRWVHYPLLIKALYQLLQQPPLLVQAHHNCIMTKQPRFSSDSWWHQDCRYWSFQQQQLISAWLALGEETRDNGCLMVIPGSHLMTFEEHQFDNDKFFLSDRRENQSLLANKEYIQLAAGDLVLFHSRLLHAATRNNTQTTKLAAVFTFRYPSDGPLPGSRSASCDDIPLVEDISCSESAPSDH